MNASLHKDRSTNPSAAGLKTEHQEAVALLVEEFLESKPSRRNIDAFLGKISNATDQTLIRLWQSNHISENIALAAVGGYGRAELFPYSDVDVLVLLPDDLVLTDENSTRQSIEGFIRRSWDLGLRIGSSVRTTRECLEESDKDITVQTALLESRFITGNQALYDQFTKRYFEHMDSTRFVQAKLSEMRRRHRKYSNTPYALEPNCKESPGGLRDLHVILWITKACGLGHNWTELKQNGLLTELEERQLRHSEAWLKLVRAHLHLSTKRHEDRLIFDLQEKIAAALNYQPTSSRRASEVFMRRYYRTAKIIAQINHIFISGIDERILNHQEISASRALGTYFADRAGMLDIVHENLYRQHPEQILQTFLLFAQENDQIKTLSARTFRALYNARILVNADFRQNPVNKETFMNILKCTSGVYRAFDLMNQTGILERYLPVFGNIVGQMQHDLFHVYTVDQHTLTVLRNIRYFFIPEHAQEYPLCSEIAAEFDKPWLLYIAALFHDIAKGRHGDHSTLGAQEVVSFAKQHGLSRDEHELLQFLITNHLTLSHIAQKEDIGDPEVIGRFAALVKNERYLNALYLLTVADIRGTSPKVWNNWKAHLLEHLYQVTLHALGGHMPDPAALVNTRKRQALTLLEKRGFTSGNEQQLWATLGVGYFMQHEPEDIVWHTQMLWDQVASTTPIVQARVEETHNSLQVLIYTADRPDLFARICGFFSMTDLSIVDARIHTTSPSSKNTTGWALDTFHLIPASHLKGEPEEAMDAKALEKAIIKNLQKTLENDLPLREPRSSRTISRRAKYFPLPPKIDLQPDEKRQRWLLSITTGDRVGLLYTISYILSQKRIDVELAKISTLGDRAEDTFVISSPLLEQTQFQEDLENELFHAIQL